MAQRRVLKEFVFGAEEETPSSPQRPFQLPLTAIVLPASQPRRYFEPNKLAELTQSVRQYGILEPLLVRPLNDSSQYELVAGERRYRAAQEAGLEEVPVTVRDLTDEDAIALSLIENLQREDLNPVEETEGILQLLSLRLQKETKEVIALLYQMRNEFRGTVSQNVLTNEIQQNIQSVFESLGLLSWESFITSRLPLLKLPENVLEKVREGKLAYTKAVVIAKVKDDQQRQEILEEAVDYQLSLSQIKERVKALTQKPSSDSQTPSLKKQVDDTLQRLKKSKIWDHPQKQERLSELLAEIETLMAAE